MSCKQAVKPPMPLRGNCNAAVVKYVYQASVLCLAVTGVFYLIFTRTRHNAYHDFYKRYDPEAAFTRMVKKGDYFKHLEPCP